VEEAAQKEAVPKEAKLVADELEVSREVEPDRGLKMPLDEAQ